MGAAGAVPAHTSSVSSSLPELGLPAVVVPQVQLFLEQHSMELGDEAEVKTAAKLAQMMAYQNKNMLQVRWWPGAHTCCRNCWP